MVQVIHVMMYVVVVAVVYVVDQAVRREQSPRLIMPLTLL
jgi:hypothetical protein